MASKSGRLISFFRSPASSTWRWMSTSTSTETVKKEKEGTVLFRRLAALGFGNTKAKVGDVLDEWEKGGNSHSLHRPQIISFATQLRRFKKYHLALQLYQWMDEKKKTMNNADRAIRIDLLAKTEGIASAENYFNSLEKSAKTKKTYGALLNCYCHGRMVEKATELFRKMTQLNFHANPLNYNNMMALYMKVGLPEKVPLLVQEMKEKNIEMDLYSYNQLMTCYGALNDIRAVEGVLKRMEINKVKYDWLTLGNLANIYINAGLMAKANAALEELEKRKISKDPEAFHTLINLYSRTSNAIGVNRAWVLLKSKFPKPCNASYLIMLLALSRLGDFDSLEMLFKEWESGCSNYDIRISNVVLESYLDRDMVEEASLLYENIIKRGVRPNSRAYNSFIILCLKTHQIDFALKCLEAGASNANSGRNSWFPPQETVNDFLRYFEQEKDGDNAGKFCEIMKKINRLDAEIEKVCNAVLGAKVQMTGTSKI